MTEHPREPDWKEFVEPQLGGRDGVSAGGAYFDIDDGSAITTGRRIYPEESS